jgi:hypothetical protein
MQMQTLRQSNKALTFVHRTKDYWLCGIFKQGCGLNVSVTVYWFSHAVNFEILILKHHPFRPLYGP